MKREPRVEIVDLGDWGDRALVAEYDASCDTIRVNARAVARIRARAGDCEAERFMACAIAHERFHRAFPGASEAAAHAHVRIVAGAEPLRFEAWLRGARSGRR